MSRQLIMLSTADTPTSFSTFTAVSGTEWAMRRSK